MGLAALLVVFAIAMVLSGCARDEPQIRTVQLPPGFVEVQAGERADAVARRAGVPFDQLALINGLTPPYSLRPGQVLRLPDAGGYQVVTGDTVSAIAERYGTSVAVVAGLNDLDSPYLIYPGDRLTVPTAVPRSVASGRLALGPDDPVVAAAPSGRVTVEPLGGTGAPTPISPATPAPTATVTAIDPLPLSTEPLVADGAPQPLVPPAEPSPLDGLDGGTTAATGSVTTAPLPPATAPGTPRFAWPVVGRRMAGFGPGADGAHNDGVNIAADRGTAVLASEAGTVAYAGNELRGFGNLVLVRHSGDWVTAYAHLDRILVARDEQIRMGQPVGTVGDTGSVAEPQLHFEVRRGTEAIDPETVLPPFPQ